MAAPAGRPCSNSISSPEKEKIALLDARISNCKTSANLLHVLQRLVGGEAAIYDRLPLAQDRGTG